MREREALDIEKISKNSKLLINNIPFAVEDVDFVKPGKGRAIYRLKIRNMLNNSLQEVTYHSADSVEETRITVREMQYLYKEGDNYLFMDTETFEQSPIPESVIGDRWHFFKEGMNVMVTMWEERPIDINLPITMDLKVVKTGVSTRADTVTAQNKMAELETGFQIGVPTFVKEGDIIKVDTRNGTYLERTNK
jgi:elongation factor P